MDNENPPPAHSTSEHTRPPAPHNPERETATSLDVSNIMATLRREKWIILVTCLLVAGTISGYTYMQPPVYEASSLVKLNDQNGGPSGITTNLVGEGAIGGTPNLAGEIGVLQNSVALAREVAEECKTRDKADSTGATLPILLEEKTDLYAATPVIARRIMDQVEFMPNEDRHMIEIVVESRDPEEASTLANVYARKYKEYSKEQARASVQAARKFLEEQAEKQREKISRLQKRWQSFMRENQLVSRGTGGEHVTSYYNELKARRDEVAFELERTRTQLSMLRQQLQQFRPKLESTLMKEQETSSLRSEIQALENEIGQMRAQVANYYAENPDLEGDTTRIQRQFPALARLLQQTRALEERKHALTQKLVDKVSTSGSNATVDTDPIGRVSELRAQITEQQLTVNQLESQLGALDEQISEYESELTDIPAEQVQRQQLDRKLTQAETFHETIMGELQRMTVAEESELGYVEVVRSAFVPSVPVRPDVLLNLLLGLVLGLGFGIGAAFLKEVTNTRIRQPQDIEDRGYDLLGVVPSMNPEIAESYDGRDFIEVDGRQLSTRLMPLLNPWSWVTENYRLLRAKLRRGRSGGPHTLLVTSAQKGAGKTVTAVNLALTEALSGKKVLLIDADMRKPAAHELLGMSRTPGLASVTENLPDATCWQTPIDGLYFIPAGIADNPPAKLLDSGRIEQLVSAVEHRFDAVVLDSPPTRAASDAIVIGAQTGASTLVVATPDQEVTALDSVMNSLRAANVNIAGVLLNRFEGQPGESYDHHTYDYYDYDEEYADYRIDTTGGGLLP